MARRDYATDKERGRSRDRDRESRLRVIRQKRWSEEEKAFKRHSEEEVVFVVPRSGATWDARVGEFREVLTDLAWCDGK